LVLGLSLEQSWKLSAARWLKSQGKSGIDIPFDWILAEVLNKHGTLEFVLRDPAKCPRCNRQIAEKTFVKCTSDSLDYDHRILTKRKCHVPHSMFS
jgi:hypothetical protein